MGTCSLLEKVSSLGEARRVKKLLVTFSGFQKPINGLPVKRSKSANRSILWLILVLWFAAKRNVKFSIRNVKAKGHHLSTEGIQKGYLFCHKMEYNRVSLPV